MDSDSEPPLCGAGLHNGASVVSRGGTYEMRIQVVRSAVVGEDAGDW